VNLWIKTPDLKTLSHMYRHAWHAGLKTTYYLRGLGASNIEKATVQVKKEMRGAAGETKAETATRDAANRAVPRRLPRGGACSEAVHRRGEARLLHRGDAQRGHLRGLPVKWASKYLVVNRIRDY
jgi:ribonucleotide reductase alpha subunit